MDSEMEFSAIRENPAGLSDSTPVDGITAGYAEQDANSDELARRLENRIREIDIRDKDRQSKLRNWTAGGVAALIIVFIFMYIAVITYKCEIDRMERLAVACSVGLVTSFCASVLFKK